MKYVIVIIAALVASTYAQAGDNSCYGRIVVDGSRAKIVAPAIKIGEHTQPAYVCGTFSVASSVGQRILKTCPHGSICTIDQDLPPGGVVSNKTSLEIRHPLSIERERE